MKDDHEVWISRSRIFEMPRFGFEELKIVTEWLLNSSTEIIKDLSITPIKEKIKKNELSQISVELIKIGLVKSREVGEFLSSQNKIDITFSEKLRDGLLAEYYRLRAENYRGDDLFEGMYEYISAGDPRIRIQAAALAILVHFFESCDLFER